MTTRANDIVPTRWVYFFGDPLPADVEARDVLGGKGASLSEMIRAGLAVPSGFTIITTACVNFFANDGEWPAGLEAQIRGNLKRLEEAAGRIYAGGAQPLLLSVRSGAPVSMPGMMDTILNCGLHRTLIEQLGGGEALWGAYCQFIEVFARSVAGVRLRSTPNQPPSARALELLDAYAQQTGAAMPADPWEQLKESINGVFRSWRSERAEAYRRRHGLSHQSGTAVNVQAMFPSEVSGVLFTLDPAAVATSQMVLEASPGLGEAVVSGAVTPDRFLVKRADLSVIETIAGPPGPPARAPGLKTADTTAAVCLTQDQVRAICELGLKIERHFGRPMDIEWGWAAGKLALLQCRSIQGIELAQAAEAFRQEEIARLRRLNGAARVWVAHNLGETLQNPTPLTWDIIRHFMCGEGGFGRLYQELGYQPAPDVCEQGFLELICGRIYADPDRLAKLFWTGVPLAYDLKAVSANPRILDRAPTKFEPDKTGHDFLLRLPNFLAGMLRATRKTRRLRATVAKRFAEQALPAFLKWIGERRALDLTTLTTSQLLAELHDRRRKLDEFGMESLLPGFFGGMALAELERLLVRILGPREGPRLAASLTVALEGDTTLEQSRCLVRVSTGQATLAEFLEQYGHRCPGEMELAEPRWREDSRRLEALVARLRSTSAGARFGSSQEHDEPGRQVRARWPEILAQAGGSCFKEEAEALIAQARALLPYREAGKHWLMMGYELIRLALLEMGRRTGLGPDVFYLHLAELEPALSLAQPAAALAETIAERKQRRQAAARLACPPVVDSRHLDDLGLPTALTNAEELAGEPVSPGTADGPVWIVDDPCEAGELGADYILVCPSTDPGWTPLFLNARGLVVERGGILSHGAIVARDFGIPAIVCPGAAALLRPGEHIRVDGNTGRITRRPGP